MQKPNNVVTVKSVKLVGAISSAELGELNTVIDINSKRAVLSPYFVFPFVKCNEYFLQETRHGSNEAATRTGKINEILF